MNLIDAIEITRDVAASNWHASDEEREAMNMVADLIAAYDALAPDWTQMMPLPLGIDWRLCIWQRPEAQP